MRFARLLMLLAAGGAVWAQTSAPWDTSGNSMLSGTYYFRQVYYVIGDEYGDLGEAVTIYGTMSFSGNGTYTIAASNSALILDSSVGEPEVFTTTGTYSIGAAGYGFLSSPYASGDLVYGLVSANGVFVGSSTDNSYGYNDMFVAAPLASPVPTASSFTGTWTAVDFDFSSGNAEEALGLIFNMSPDGNGNLNAGPITAYTSDSAEPYTQTSSGLKYIFSNGAAVATFPVAGEIISGQKYFYFSRDGNFMFGGSPVTSETPFDFIVAVKTTASPTLSGLYYQAGLYNNEGDLGSYFGSFNMIAGASPQTYLGHQRINDFAGSNVYDYTYNDTFGPLSGDLYSSLTTHFIVGAGGSEMITAGIGPTIGISIALQAPTPSSNTAVYINPTGVVNSASDAPFTAGIAPGELLTLYGSNLAPSTQVAGIPFPTTGLNGVQVMIGGLPAAIYYVSATQISAIVPYGVTIGDVVDIQVNNNGTLSNAVTNYVANTAPGVFTQNQNGTGYGEIEHLGIGNSVAAAGSIISDSNPAVEGETLAAYLTGLGTVSPSITDGAPGASSAPLNQTVNTITLDFDGAAGTNDYSGLAPGFSGLYQLNFTVPSTGVTVGPNYFDIAGPDSVMSYLLIPIQAAPTAATTADVAKAAVKPRFIRPSTGSPSLRNKQPRKPFSQAKIAEQK